MAETPTPPVQGLPPDKSHLPTPEIRTEDLHKSFAGKPVLNGINIQINSGEIVAIVGSSGGGKSTLLRHFTGHFQPDQGKVLIADHESQGSPLVDLATLDKTGMEQLERHWAVVFQQNGLLSGTTYYNIALPLQAVQNLDEDVIRQRVNQMMAAVGLDTQDEDRQVDELSGGMAKRVAIARALAIDPILLLYDEPTTGLDPSRSYQIQDLIQSAHERRTAAGFIRTTVLITHDKELLIRLQPRIAMLDAGRIIFDGTYENFEHSDLPAIQPYIKLMPALHLGLKPET
jgi:phospholipid/cholesterol/gamma-HCH transport system ATP-binding protein